MLRKFILCLISIFYLSTSLYAIEYPSPLYYPYQINTVNYNYLNSDGYDSTQVGAYGLNNIKSNIISYIADTHSVSSNMFKDNPYINKEDLSLSTIGLGYSAIIGNHWAGGSIISSSDDLFGDINFIDFELFYMYKILEAVKLSEKFDDTSTRDSYYRLFVGINYATFSPFGEKFPLPVIRFELNNARMNLILGYPLTYFKFKFSRFQSVEITYKPVLDLAIAYNLTPKPLYQLSISFILEHDRYLLDKISNNVNYFERSKFFTDLYWLRFSGSINIGKVLQLTPYFQLLLTGEQYIGKTFYDTKTQSTSTGFGYSLGATMSIKY